MAVGPEAIVFTGLLLVLLVLLSQPFIPENLICGNIFTHVFIIVFISMSLNGVSVRKLAIPTLKS